MSATIKTIGNLTYVKVPKSDMYDGNGYKIFTSFDEAIAANPDVCPIENVGLAMGDTYYNYKLKDDPDNEFMFWMYNGYIASNITQGIGNAAMSPCFGSNNYTFTFANDMHFFYNKDFFCAYTDRGYWSSSDKRGSFLIASKVYNVDTDTYAWRYYCIYLNRDTTIDTDNQETMCATYEARNIISDRFGFGSGSHLPSCKNAVNAIYPLCSPDLPYICPFFYKIGITTEDHYTDMDRKFSAKFTDLNGNEHPCSKIGWYAIMGDIEIPD